MNRCEIAISQGETYSTLDRGVTVMPHNILTGGLQHHQTFSPSQRLKEGKIIMRNPSRGRGAKIAGSAEKSLKVGESQYLKSYLRRVSCHLVICP